MTTAFVTIFESARNDETPVIDLLHLAESRYLVVLCRQNKVTHYFQEV
jgi:hypothetical protein